MIRKLHMSDIHLVADIWLDANLKAHHFIAAPYWTDHFDIVKEMLPQAEAYVYEDDTKIQGFIGLNGDYIAGIFVRSEAQSRGIGKQLLDFAKGKKMQLYLHVYQKNTRALNFYLRENFKLLCKSVDKNTGETEYSMAWKP